MVEIGSNSKVSIASEEHGILHRREAHKHDLLQRTPANDQHKGTYMSGMYTRKIPGQRKKTQREKGGPFLPGKSKSTPMQIFLE